VRRRKTGHGALLPLPHEVGEALVDYLRDGRPVTTARQVFVLHRLRPEAPISSSIVNRAVGNALAKAGIDAPRRGGNLLRHSLATDLLRHGASLPQIADRRRRQLRAMKRHRLRRTSSICSMAGVVGVGGAGDPLGGGGEQDGCPDRQARGRVRPARPGREPD
jgi:integrase